MRCRCVSQPQAPVCPPAHARCRQPARGRCKALLLLLQPRARLSTGRCVALSTTGASVCHPPSAQPAAMAAARACGRKRDQPVSYNKCSTALPRQLPAAIRFQACHAPAAAHPHACSRGQPPPTALWGARTRAWPSHSPAAAATASRSALRLQIIAAASDNRCGFRSPLPPHDKDPDVVIPPVLTQLLKRHLGAPGVVAQAGLGCDKSRVGQWQGGGYELISSVQAAGKCSKPPARTAAGKGPARAPNAAGATHTHNQARRRQEHAAP